MSDKEIKVAYTETGITAYVIIQEENTGFFYDETDGDFRAWNSPTTDNFLSLTESTNVKGLYEVTVPDAGEPAWDNGRYTIIAYKQSGGSPVPASDTAIGQGDMYIVNDTEIILNADVSELHFQNGAVWIDTINGSSGTAYPLGTALNPVDNFSDALSIANTNNLIKFYVIGSITIGGSDSISNMFFIDNGNHATIAFTNGCTTTNTTFQGHLHLSGTLNGHIHCYKCHFSASSNLEGFFDEVLFDDGNYTVASTGLSRFIKCTSSGQQGQAVTIDTTGANTDLGIWGWSGKLEIDNKDGSTTFDIEMITGELEVTSGCTAGRVNVRGIAELTDNSGAGCNVVSNKLLTNQVADAVWEEATADHTTASTFGDINNKLIRVLGLSHENVYYDNPVFDSNDIMTSCRVRIFPTKADADAQTNVLTTYTITAVSVAANQFTTWKQVKE